MICPKTPNYAERTTGLRSEVSVVRMLINSIRSLPAAALPIIPCFRGSNKNAALHLKEVRDRREVPPRAVGRHQCRLNQLEPQTFRRARARERA
jgi:hypothetical protein